MSTIAIIVAAGRGTRAGEGPPKQFRKLGGVSILARSISPFLDHPGVAKVLVVIGDDSVHAYEYALSDCRYHPRFNDLLPPVTGGASRQQSVANALAAIARTVSPPPKHILIHDAARPFVSPEVISRVLSALENGEAAIPAVPVTDTLKRQNRDMSIKETIARHDLWRAQTPQGFSFTQIREAHQAAVGETGCEFTDDASLLEWLGAPVRLVPGEERNVKLTTPEDIAMAEHILSSQGRGSAFETRVGSGFDVHRFCPGSSLMLCGIEIAHSMGLEGHSDADVALHALTDAILGGLADADIGEHFPPSEARWRGAPSAQFLAHAAERVRTRGGRIVHVDVTLICERPKVGPHRQAMRESVANIIGIDIGRVSVKATTSERLGFTGRGEGIAAMASATIELAREDVK